MDGAQRDGRRSGLNQQQGRRKRRPGKENAMRAIFINAVDRKVEEVQVDNDLQAIYAQI